MEKELVLDNVLKLVDNGAEFYKGYMDITTNKLKSITDNDEQALKMLIAYNYYLGQIDALETIRNYIKLSLEDEGEPKTVFSID